MFTRLKPNTLRKQIFYAYTSILLIILLTVGIYIYNQVGDLLKKNAEDHMVNTAVQATTNIDLIVEQVDSFASQVVTNVVVQTILQEWVNGDKPTFEKIQALQKEVRRLEVYQKGIKAIEVYNLDYESYLPITNERLDERYDFQWIKQTDEASGKVVWLDYNEEYNGSMVAMSNIRLMNQSFEHAGYLVLHVDTSLFALNTGSKEKEEYYWLSDQQGQVIYTNAESFVKLPDDQEKAIINIHGTEFFRVSSQIPTTGWNISLLTSAHAATEGLSVLRSTIPITIFFSSLIFLFLSYLLSGVISKPILNLIKTMRSVRLGALKPIEAKSSLMEITELNHTYNQMVDSLNGLIQVVYEKEILQSKTELKALQAQINPHFLFNTLDAFYWELEENGQHQLAEIIVAMSGVFRYVINKNDNEQWVTVGDELEHAERYMLIMKMRLMDRFTWNIKCDKAYRSIPIPKLTIQPIIENAIEHGVEQSLEQGTINIELEQRDDYLVISVRDSGPGFSEERLRQVTADINSDRMSNNTNEDNRWSESGVGLKNTNQRLKLYYGQQRARIHIINNTDGVTIEIHIPIR